MAHSFFSILQKHIKRQIISLQGGFQIIADLNTYHTFIASLKQQRVTDDFSNLKMLGHCFIGACFLPAFPWTTDDITSLYSRGREGPGSDRARRDSIRWDIPSRGVRPFSPLFSWSI